MYMNVSAKEEFGNADAQMREITRVINRDDYTCRACRRIANLSSRLCVAENYNVEYSERYSSIDTSTLKSRALRGNYLVD